MTTPLTDRPALAAASFTQKRLPADRDAVAPDGSDVRILLGLKGGGMAHFELPPGASSPVGERCGASRERTRRLSSWKQAPA
jgi:hypothetical protein